MPVRSRGLHEKEAGPGLTRLLLVEGDVTARLALQALLKASGYAVDSAASAAEAMDKLETEQYALVLCDPRSGTTEDCHRVIDHAKAQEYRPATAVLTASGLQAKVPKSGRLLIEPQEVPALLEKIADLLAGRAAGRARRKLRGRAASPALVVN